MLLNAHSHKQDKTVEGLRICSQEHHIIII